MCFAYIDLLLIASWRLIQRQECDSTLSRLKQEALTLSHYGYLKSQNKFVGIIRTYQFEHLQYLMMSKLKM